MEEHFDIFFIEDNPHKAEPVISSMKMLHVLKRIKHIDEGEILQLIKEPTKVIPVVGLNWSKEEKGVIESYKSGVNSYLVNPVTFKSFGKATIERGLYRMILDQNANP